MILVTPIFNNPILVTPIFIREKAMCSLEDLMLERDELVYYFDSYDGYMYHVAVNYEPLFQEILFLTKEEFNQLKGELDC